jgi:plastocyanin
MIVAGVAMTAAAALLAACGSDGDSGRGEATADAENRIEIVADNLQFDLSELTASAGEVVIALDNRDGGQPHNIQFFRGDDADGESVGTTDVKSGPAEDVLTMNLDAGEYYYHCDVHPNMKGTLTVE